MPTKVFFLNMPPEKTIKLMEGRENKFSHNETKDIHERDKSHLIDSYNAACSVAKKYGWYEVKCCQNDEIRTIDDIHEEIYNEVKRVLNK